MLQILYMSAAFMAAPIMLCVPPIRSFCLFLHSTEFLFRGAISLASTVCPILNSAISRFLPFLLAATRR